MNRFKKLTIGATLVAATLAAAGCQHFETSTKKIAAACASASRRIPLFLTVL